MDRDQRPQPRDVHLHLEQRRVRPHAAFHRLVQPHQQAIEFRLDDAAPLGHEFAFRRRRDAARRAYQESPAVLLSYNFV